MLSHAARSVLTTPTDARDKAAQLAFLQALIIELGFYTPSAPAPAPAPVPTPTPAQGTAPLAALPDTLSAARAALKARAFVSVREYLDARAHGPQALAQVLHPSRASLRRALAGRAGAARRAPRADVKETGLSVLLVSCYR
jgi:hypothetical protein